MRLKAFYFIVILIISVIIGIYLQKTYQKDLSNLGINTTASIEKIYKTSFNTYKFSAQKEYYNLLQDKKALELLKQFKTASNNEKKVLRGKLYRYYAKHYRYLKTVGVRQFHFHTHKGESLLRFHKPYANGDPLINIRDSIKVVNTEFKNVFGFEGGKIYPGFRYMFPITYQEEHLGSIEYSVAFEAIEQLMKETFTTGTFMLHLDHTISYDKVFPWFRKYFTLSTFGGKHYVENQELSTITSKVVKDLTISKINMKVLKSSNFKEKFEKRETFSIPVIINNTGYVVSFLSIKDTTNTHAAYLVSYLQNDYLVSIKDKYIIFYVILFIATLFIFSLVYIILNQIEKIILQKEQLEEINEQQFNQLEEYVDIIDRNVLVSSTDLKGRITYVSEALCQMSGYTKEELIGQNHNIFRHPEMSDSVFKAMWKALEKNMVYKGEINNLRKDGTNYWVKVTITPMYKENKKIGYTAIRQDVSDKKIIEEISITDSLTKIFNRRHFDKIFPRIINSAKRHNTLVSFLLIDVDHFKQYNDTYGHKMGDDVLVEVADAIQKTLKRADDYCFRLGGEEFGVIFGIEDSKHAITFANTIRRNICNLQIEHKSSDTNHYVTASIGLVCKKANQIPSSEELYQETDTYLYQAKNSGRNRVVSNLDSQL